MPEAVEGGPSGELTRDESDTPPEDRCVSRWYHWTALLAVPLLGTVLCLLITRHGETSDQDSAAYLGAAYNLLHGRGLTTPFDLSESTLSPAQAFAFKGAVPLVQYPPLYPTVLAALSAFGTSITAIARWLNAVLLGANLFVFELLLQRFSKSRVVVPIAGALLLLAGPVTYTFSFRLNVLWLSSAVLSEPFLLFVFLLGVLFVDKFLEDPTRGKFAGIAACVAAAPLIRYAGFGLVAGAAIVIALWAPLSRSLRWKSALGVAACGLVPSALWSLVVTGVMHGGSARSVAWHPESGIVQAILAVGSSWILPLSLATGYRDWLFLAVLAIAGVLLAVQRRRSDQDARQVDHVFALGIFALSYLVVVVFTREFLDAILSMSGRILLPLVPLIYIILIAAVVGAFRQTRIGYLVVSGLCVVLAIGPVGTWLNVVDHPPPALNAEVAGAPIVHAIQRLPPGTVIASSVPDVIWTDIGRPSLRVPVSVQPLTQRENLDFEKQCRQLAKILIRHHGVLVLIPQLDLDAVPYAASPANFKPYANVQLVREFRDGDMLFRFSPLTRSNPTARVNLSAMG